MLWGVTDIEVRWATMKLLFHSLGIVVLMLFYMVSSNGNRMYNVRVLPIMFRLRIYKSIQAPIPFEVNLLFEQVEVLGTFLDGRLARKSRLTKRCKGPSL